MVRYQLNIAHQTFYILENMMVDALHAIRFLADTRRADDKGVIDKSDSQRLRFYYFIRNSKMPEYFVHNGLMD